VDKGTEIAKINEIEKEDIEDIVHKYRGINIG